MKMNKKVIGLLAVSTLALTGLTACGSNNSSTSSSSDKVEAYTGATAGTTSFDNLQKGLSANGAWINAITADMNASGKTLTVDGTFHNEKDKTTDARKLALYTQDSNKVVTKRFVLTVDKLVVNSPGFYISNGTVKGNVEVNADGFYGQTGKGVAGEATIEGNLTFKTQAQLDAYNKLDATKKVKVTGTVEVAK